jgi:Rho termination factor, N-terminal domain
MKAMRMDELRPYANSLGISYKNVPKHDLINTILKSSKNVTSRKSTAKQRRKNI